MNPQDLENLTIAGLAAEIKNRSISPVEVTRLFLKRIERINPATEAGTRAILVYVGIRYQFKYALGAVIALFGALAGVIPAYHAAKIQPIEALRSE